MSYSEWEQLITRKVYVDACTLGHACELLREMWDEAQEQGRLAALPTLLGRRTPHIPPTMFDDEATA